jgi:hypothetical protein
MQIRGAVNAPLLLQRRWFHPILDLSVRAFSRAYRNVPAAAGTAVVFEVDAEGENVWTVVREESGWSVFRGRQSGAAAGVRVDADTAWKLLYNALTAADVRSRVNLTGDRALAAPMLAARSVMVHDRDGAD